MTMERTDEAMSNATPWRCTVIKYMILISKHPWKCLSHILLMALFILITDQLTLQFLSTSLYDVHVTFNYKNESNMDNLSGEKTDYLIDIPTAKGEYLVPNIVHFIHFKGQKDFKFVNYLSILSAYKVQKPQLIMLHCDHIPTGAWWKRLWREVPLRLTHRLPPTHIYGQKVSKVYHQADIAKLEVLQEYGGIYMDYDVIVINSLDPLRRYPVTLGKEKPPKLIAGVIIAERNALFIRILHASYSRNYRAWKWDYNCAVVAYQLYLKRPELVHIETTRLTTPDWLDRHLLFQDTINWRQLYVLHLMFHEQNEGTNPEKIKTLKGMIGSILRNAYYGDSDIIR